MRQTPRTRICPLANHFTKFIALFLLVSTPVFAGEPYGAKPMPPVPEMDTTTTLLTSAPWKVSGGGWADTRTFDRAGTFTTIDHPDEHGDWSISGDTITLTFADGHKDTISLPLNPKGTVGTDRVGGPTVAVLQGNPPAKAGPPGLAKLRQDYIASLNDLLRQYVEQNKRKMAKAVAAEIEKVAPQAPGAAGTPPCGTWLWLNNSMTVTLHPDGTVTRNSMREDKNSRDRWHWIDQPAGKFQIAWDNGWLDKATLSPDGRTLTIVNNAGDAYTVRCLSQDGPAAVVDKKAVPEIESDGSFR